MHEKERGELHAKMEKREICMKKRGENTCKNEEVGDLHEKERGGNT